MLVKRKYKRFINFTVMASVLTVTHDMAVKFSLPFPKTDTKHVLLVLVLYPAIKNLSKLNEKLLCRCYHKYQILCNY